MTRRVWGAPLSRPLLRAAAAFAAAVVLLTGAVAPAAADRREPSLRVMTRNLYLGADLTPALDPRNDPAAFLAAVRSIYAEKQATDFDARAKAIAQEIDRTGPDLIGLQEVSRWETSGPLTSPGPPTQDFLEVLQQALAARGLNYAVAAVSENAVIGPVPLIAPVCQSINLGDCRITFTDRDVILVNQSTRRLHVKHPQSGTYAAQLVFTPPLPGAQEVSFDRGWASIDGKFRGRPFHFVTTHLETSRFAEIQQAQATEFLAGPAFGRGADLVTGDFNSAADGSSTATYGLLTDRLRDAWSVRGRAPGYTCCHEPTLTDPRRRLSSRIDLILVHGAKPLAARRVGTRPIATTPPRWASDHAGVVADVRLAKKRLS